MWGGKTPCWLARDRRKNFPIFVARKLYGKVSPSFGPEPSCASQFPGSTAGRRTVRQHHPTEFEAFTKRGRPKLLVGSGHGRPRGRPRRPSADVFMSYIGGCRLDGKSVGAGCIKSTPTRANFRSLFWSSTCSAPACRSPCSIDKPGPRRIRGTKERGHNSRKCGQLEPGSAR